MGTILKLNTAIYLPVAGFKIITDYNKRIVPYLSGDLKKLKGHPFKKKRNLVQFLKYHFFKLYSPVCLYGSFKKAGLGNPTKGLPHSILYGSQKISEKGNGKKECDDNFFEVEVE